jgi:hypothetical protein
VVIALVGLACFAVIFGYPLVGAVLAARGRERSFRALDERPAPEPRVDVESMSPQRWPWESTP